MRRALRLTVLCVLATLGVGACALQGIGLGGEVLSPDASADATRVDPRDGIDAASDANGNTDPDVLADSPADATTDACAPTITVVENFSAGIPASWLATGVTSAVATDGGTGAFVRLIPAGQTSKVAGLWLRAPQDLTTFSVEARVRAERPGGGNLSDGLVLAWVDVTDDAGALSDVLGGVALGVPKNTSGFGLALDVYDNGGAANDPNVPYWGVFKIDRSRGDPGTYDWHVQSTAAIANAFDVWHVVALDVAGGKLSVTVDGAGVFPDAGAVTPLRGTLGFVAAVGGITGAGFDVDEVKTTFPNPLCADR